MGQYTVNVTATSNTSINTDDTFIELTAPAATTIRIKRVRVGFSDGTLTAGVDNHFKVKLYRWDTTTAGSSSAFTPVPRKALSAASGTSCKTKTTTTALALGTTNVTILDAIAPNGRALWEWVARDDDDMIVTKSAGLFGVVIASAVTAQKFMVSVDFVE